MSMAANLVGTHSLAELIDSSARRGAERGGLDFARVVDRVLSELEAADLHATVVTVQGPIRLVDYLTTRCIEAVVHGGDIVEPVHPDPDAQAIAAEALMEVLSIRAPQLAQEARSLPVAVWIDVATGRLPGSGKLAVTLPVMT